MRSHTSIRSSDSSAVAVSVTVTLIVATLLALIVF